MGICPWAPGAPWGVPDPCVHESPQAHSRTTVPWRRTQAGNEAILIGILALYLSGASRSLRFCTWTANLPYWKEFIVWNTQLYLQ